MKEMKEMKEKDFDDDVWLANFDLLFPYKDMTVHGILKINANTGKKKYKH